MPEPDILSRILAGHPSSVPAARSAVRGFLGQHARTDDAALVVSELATNAVRHSASRDGTYELRLEVKPGRLRIEVVDQGAPAQVAVVGEPGESGRGLLIVEALADDWGHEGRSGLRVWWAELWADEDGRDV
jgi:anti-sigma regulatory factor (Ser/Thr protein kinase)